MQNGKDTSGLKKAIADHARMKTGQELSDSELESAGSAVVSLFLLFAQTDQKLMKESRERDNRNPDHPDQA